MEERDVTTRFRMLFTCNQRAFGSYQIKSQEPSGKLTGVARTSLVVDGDAEWHQLWQDHLGGTRSIGIIPIREDGTCMFGAVDIDVYADLDPAKIATQLLHMDLPLIPCRSKSGGVHIYLFCKEPIAANRMQERLRDIAARLGHGKSEIFPKQTKTTGKDLGSWLNMPYFGGDTSNRYGVQPNGDPYSMEAFLAAAEALRVSEGWIATPLPGDSPTASQGRKTRKPTFVLPDRIGEGQRDLSLTSFAGSMRRNGASPEVILAALREVNRTRCDPPMSDSDVERIARSVGRYDPKDSPEDAGLTKELADAITSKDAFARDAGGLLYHWEGGVYRPTGERLVQRNVKELCQALGRTKQWSPDLATRVLQWILVDAPELWERPPLDVLNVRNGLLDTGTRTLFPHSPDHLSPVQIAATFDPEATCPEIDKFIRDVFADDTQHLPHEVTAWLMLPDTSIQKAVLCLGEGANGKSVWLNLLLTFLGRENVSTISLHRLEADKFSVARLVGKLCNIGTDLPTSALSGTSMLKALTGGDVITAERKFESSFEFRPFVRLLFSANSAPRSDDATHGFFRRWLCIQFTRTFDESDPNTVPRTVLDARLSQPGELSGMLNRALDALPTVRRGRFTESPSVREALDEFRRTTDPMAVWLDQNTIEVPGAVMPKDDLRRSYAQACQDNGRPLMTDVQFTAALKRLRPKAEVAKRRVNGRPTPVFVGLGMVTQDPDPSGMF